MLTENHANEGPWLPWREMLWVSLIAPLSSPFSYSQPFSTGLSIQASRFWLSHVWHKRPIPRPSYHFQPVSTPFIDLTLQPCWWIRTLKRQNFTSLKLMENPFALKDTKKVTCLGWGGETCLGLVMHVFNTSTPEAGGSLWVQGFPGLHSKLLESQDYIQRPCLKKLKEKSN